MKRGWGKGGQFYLVAAIILTAIVISIVTVSNYSKKNDYADINSLRDELKIEGGKTIDYGVANSLSQQSMDQLLTNFTDKYIDSETRDKDLYFVFGDQNTASVKGYQGTAKDVSLDSTAVTSSAGSFSGSTVPSGSSVSLIVDENAYIFDLKNGENFYFVISREIAGEDYVVTG